MSVGLPSRVRVRVRVRLGGKTHIDHLVKISKILLVSNSCDSLPIYIQSLISLPFFMIEL